MIETKDLHKSFKNFEALKGIDLRVQPGDVYGFLGKNGAGKSTTMNILAGLSRPSSGTVRVGNVNLSEVSSPGELDLGYLPEEPRFYPWMKAKEAIDFYLNKDDYTASEARRRVSEILDWIGLSSDAHRRIGGFSRGMKQRLGLGIALINDPSLLLLDEPSSALDPQGRKDVLQLILELKEMGKTVFLSTHILADAERVCDRVSILSKGKIVLEESLTALKRDNIHPQMRLEFMQEPNQDTLKQILTDLPQLDGIEGATFIEGALFIKLQDEEHGKKALFSYLGTSSLAVAGVNQQASSLEDIFLTEVNHHV